jgi:hypothetical protein
LIPNAGIRSLRFCFFKASERQGSESCNRESGHTNDVAK